MPPPAAALTAVSSPPSPVQRWWRRPGTIIFAAALVSSLLAFAWTLGGYFLGDDFGYVGRFRAFPLAQWPSLFVHEWSGGMWGFPLRELRPVAALSFLLDARVWGDNPFGYRLTNLLLHVASTGFVGLTAWRFAGRNLGCGVCAALLFAWHPVHAEPVLWITGRVDILPTVCYLGALLALWRYRDGGRAGWLAVIWGGYAAAGFAKEFGLTLPLMALAADAIIGGEERGWRHPKTWMPYLGWLAIALVYYFCRRTAFGAGGVGAGLPSVLSPEFHVQFCQRQLTYLGHLVPPLQLWLRETAPLVVQHPLRTFALAAAAAAGLAATIVALAARRHTGLVRPLVLFGIAWYAVATLPLVVTYVSPRHLYLASAGVCIAWTLAFHAAFRVRWAFGATMGAMIAFHGVRLTATARPWHDAAQISRHLADDLRVLERRVQAGDVLLIDVPETTHDAYVWTWAVPFVLRPPFTQCRLDETLIVLEKPGLYFDWGHWHDQPAIDRLRRATGGGWLLQASDEGVVRHVALSAPRLRTAAAAFVPAPFGPAAHQAWQKLVDSSVAP